MLRIPNPGSDIDGFIRIFRDLHPFLQDKASFTLDDITNAMVAKKNVTSQGAIGPEALRRSTREDRSRDPLYNQSKMYAELYRMLGWIHSTDSNLTFSITTMGHHLATASDPRALMKECLLGIAYPNEVLSVQGSQTIRLFGTILQTIASLGTLSRDEMMAGPMCIADDSRPSLVDTMIKDLQTMRKTKGALDQRLNAIAKDRNITRSPTMENYTRYPMAALPWAGWATKPKPGVLAVTDEGRNVAARVRDSHDFRVRDFHALAEKLKRPIIISATYRMLERGAFDLDSIKNTLLQEEQALYKASIPKNLLFSPFQQLSRQTIERFAPEMIVTEGLDAATEQESPGATGPAAARRFGATTVLVETDQRRHKPPARTTILETHLRKTLADAKGIVPVAIDKLMRQYEQANQDIFYPLVADLFTILGFNCQASRAGVNYARADAMIDDDVASIPIEIKSPGEEREISVKGVRQALENKIILKARKAYKTKVDTTSLVVGFNPPNERSEVHELIEDIFHAFRVNIAVLDFRTLLHLALQSIVADRQLAMPGFQTMKGLVRVKVTSTNN